MAKLDRLTRNLGDWQHLIDNFFGEKPGKNLFSLGDAIDTTTAGGRLVLNVLLSVAQWEREAIGERTSAALQHKLANNKRAGEVRYGWDLLDDGKTLVKNPSEQHVIQRIVRMRLDWDVAQVHCHSAQRCQHHEQKGGTLGPHDRG